MTRKTSWAAWFLTMSLVAPALAAPAVPSPRAAVAAAAAADTQGASPGAPARAPGTRTFGSPADEKRYAAREAASPEARNYRAGDVIVISVTTLVIILLIVIILILI